MIIDTHAHLSCEEVFPTADAIIKRAQAAGIEKIVNICTDPLSLQRGLALREKYPFIYLTASTTPHDVEKEGQLFFPLVEKAAQQGHLVAIGETGLDYFYEHSNRECQRDYLLRYMALAQRNQLPCVFHCRDAFEDLFAVVSQAFPSIKAVIHCFTAGQDEVRQALDRGWYISLSGIVTFKKSAVLRDVVRYTPLDSLLIETDTPYLAPQSKRGQANEPSFILETAALIAELKNITVEDVCSRTAQNACEFFSL